MGVRARLCQAEQKYWQSDRLRACEEKTHTSQLSLTGDRRRVRIM
jgi:hypothetical protein